MAAERIRTLSAIAEMLWATKGVPRVLQQPSITMLWLHTFDFVRGQEPTWHFAAVTWCMRGGEESIDHNHWAVL